MFLTGATSGVGMVRKQWNLNTKNNFALFANETFQAYYRGYLEHNFPSTYTLSTCSAHVNITHLEEKLHHVQHGLMVYNMLSFLVT